MFGNQLKRALKKDIYLIHILNEVKSDIALDFTFGILELLFYKMKIIMMNIVQI